ncbi:sensor histidine kinase [Bacillus aquiflavi]|uniref:Sensor histidine kinase n=1 Tax=Bacillus aquiflavi TaxID=2672567 RepID=A0A6B3VS75_9BACI|nr:sensor histidine kinase [Bacillus aquiflavi]MBA4535682.1 sensor histidine kinase [Bacillus aquiflavi]NEY80058.1 sensor histidine kinase [Bacillus aquiflavi]UAC48989.1 sensor histidine kinase [Bacillus aquiflavi]
MKEMRSIRFWFLQSFLMTALFSSLFFFIGLQIYLSIVKNPSINVATTFWLLIYVFIILIIVGSYFGLKGSYLIKGRLGDILIYVSTLRSGKFSERIVTYEKDEIGLITDELNQLAKYIQEQVHSMQRLADEKSMLAQSAHAAAVMEERQRIARDLHDAVSQQLFALGMMSSAALRMFEIDLDKAKQQLHEIANIAAKAQMEMRALLLHLRPIQLSEDSLCDGVIKLIHELKNKTNIEFNASVDEVTHLSKSAEEHLFRIIQEALSNTLRHADASKVKLILTEKENYIYLFISDNGKGFDWQKAKIASYGLKTMRERCEEVGGIFKIRSKKNEGTYIDIRIPRKEN